MGFASRIRPSRLTLVVGFQQSRRYDGEAISSGWETLVAGGEAEEEQAFARPGLATRDHPMSSSPKNALKKMFSPKMPFSPPKDGIIVHKYALQHLLLV